MKFKYLALLILFILNMSATVIADSSQTICSETDICHSETETQLQKADTKKAEKAHCEESHCCHAGHVHHLIVNNLLVTFTVESTVYHFPEHSFSLLDTYSDLIKPPTV